MTTPTSILITDFLNAGGSGQAFHQRFLDLFDARPNYNLASGGSSISAQYFGKITESSTFFGITSFAMEKYLFTISLKESRENEEVADVSIYYKRIKEEDKEVFASIANAETGPVALSARVNNDDDSQIATAVSALVREAAEAETSTTPDEEGGTPPANAGSNTGSGTTSPNTPSTPTEEEEPTAPEEVIDYSYMVMEKENVVYEQNYLQMREHIYMGNYLSADMVNRPVEEIESRLRADSHNWFKVTGDDRFFAQNVKTDITFIPSVNGKPYYSSGQIWEVAIHDGSVFDHEEGPVRYIITGYNYNDEIDFSYVREYLVADENEAPTDIVFASTSAIANNVIVRAAKGIYYGRLTGIDPDAADDINGRDAENRFGEYDLEIIDSSIDGFEIVYWGGGYRYSRQTGQSYSVADKAWLYYKGAPSALLAEEQVSITVRATDNIGAAAEERLSYDKTFTFTVIENEAPTNIVFRPNAEYRNYEIEPLPASARLGKLSAVDPERDDVTFSLSSESTAGLYVLFGDVLAVKGRDKDFNGYDEISAVVIATDEHGATYEETFTFTVLNSEPNSAPTDIVFSESTKRFRRDDSSWLDITNYEIGVNWNGRDNDILDINAVDPDTDDITYSLGSGTADFFSLSSENRLHFTARRGDLRDFDEISAVVIATDEHGATYSETITFKIVTNWRPIDIIFESYEGYSYREITLNEDLHRIGELRGRDLDSSILTYTLGAQSHSGFSLNIRPDGFADLQFQSAPEIISDREEVSAIVVVTDEHGKSYEETFTFTIDDPATNRAPTGIDFYLPSRGAIARSLSDDSTYDYTIRPLPDGTIIEEDTGTGYITNVEGIDPDGEADEIVLTLGEGSHSGFSIAPYIDAPWTSDIKFGATKEQLKGVDEVSAVVVATDKYGASYTETITFKVVQNIAPTDINFYKRPDFRDNEFVLDQGNVLVGYFITIDEDGDSVTYSLGEGSDEGFSIRNHKLRFQTTDARLQNIDEVSAVIIANDGYGGSYEKTFTFTISHATENFAPGEIIHRAWGGSYVIDVDGKYERKIGSFYTVDRNHDTVTYALKANDESSKYLSLTSDYVNLGQGIYLKASTKVLNRFDKLSTIIVATDEHGASSEAVITFGINHPDRDQAPFDITFAKATNSDGTTLLGTLATRDADEGDTHTYSIDAASTAAGFAIQGDTLHFTGATRPAEASVTITSTDDDGLSYTETFADIL